MPSRSLEQLPRDLAAGLAPLYVIHGEEMLLALEAADSIRAAARAQGYDDREVLTVESQHFDWSRLVEASLSVSLFASRKVLEVRLPGGKPGNEGAEALVKFAARLPEDTVTLILLPKLDKTQLNSKWFDALAAVGVVLAAHSVDRQHLPQWVAGRLARQQQRLNDEAMQFFVERVEGNLLAARQEVDKLALLFPAGSHADARRPAKRSGQCGPLRCVSAVGSLAGWRLRTHRAHAGWPAGRRRNPGAGGVAAGG